MEETFKKKVDKELQLIAYEMRKFTARSQKRTASDFNSYSNQVNQLVALNVGCYDNFATLMNQHQIVTLFDNQKSLLQTTLNQMEQLLKPKYQPKKDTQQGLCKLCQQNIRLTNIENSIQNLQQQVGTGLLGSIQRELKRNQKLFTEEEDRVFFKQLNKVLVQKEKSIQYTETKITQYIDDVLTSILELKELKQFTSEYQAKHSPIDQRFAFDIQIYFKDEFSIKVPPWMKRIFSLFRKMEKKRLEDLHISMHTTALIQTDHWQSLQLTKCKNQFKELKQKYSKVNKRNEELQKDIQYIQYAKQQLYTTIANYAPAKNKENQKQVVRKDKIYKNTIVSQHLRSASITNLVQKAVQQQNSMELFRKKKTRGNKLSSVNSVNSLKLPSIYANYKTPLLRTTQNGHQSVIEEDRLSEIDSETRGNRENLLNYHNRLNESIKSQALDSDGSFTEEASSQAQIKDRNNHKMDKNKVTAISKKLSAYIEAKALANLPFKHGRHSVLEETGKISHFDSSKYNIELSRMKRKQLEILKANRMSPCCFNHGELAIEKTQIGIQANTEEENQSKEERISSLFHQLRNSLNVPIDLTYQHLCELLECIFEQKRVEHELKQSILAHKINQSVQFEPKFKPQDPFKSIQLLQKKSNRTHGNGKSNQNVSVMIEKRNQLAPNPNIINSTQNAVHPGQNQEIKASPFVERKTKRDNRIDVNLQIGNSRLCSSIASIRCNEYQSQDSLLTQHDLTLFLTAENAAKYEESLAQNYHKKKSIHFSKNQIAYFTSLFRVHETIKIHSKTTHKQLCAFIRYPIQTVLNKFSILNIVSQMGLPNFLNYFQRISWFHRNCQHKDTVVCKHINQFAKKIELILASLIHFEPNLKSPEQQCVKNISTINFQNGDQESLSAVVEIQIEPTKVD